MVLSEHRWFRVFYLCALYFAQGIPWGFVSVALVAWFVSKDYSTGEVSQITGMATLPWSFKFFWGPIIDRFSGSSLGRRKPWLLFTQGMAIMALLSIAVWTDSTTHHASAVGEQTIWEILLQSPITLSVLVANIFISMQDVATDALAVDVLSPEERGRANGFMYASNYAGTAFGGAILGTIIARYGLNVALIVQALALGCLTCLTLFVRERRPGSPDQTGETNPGDHKSPSLQQLAHQLVIAFLNLRALLGLVLAILIKIGIGCMTVVQVVYLVREGVLSNEEFSMINGGMAVALGLTGSVIGGFLADLISPRRVIIATCVLMGGFWAAFGLVDQLMHSAVSATILLCAQEFLFSIMTVALFALYMGISKKQVAATQYTAYIAILNLSTTIGSFAANRLSQSFSVPEILVICGIMQVIALLPLAGLSGVMPGRRSHTA